MNNFSFDDFIFILSMSYYLSVRWENNDTLLGNNRTFLGSSSHFPCGKMVWSTGSYISVVFISATSWAERNDNLTLHFLCTYLLAFKNLDFDKEICYCVSWINVTKSHYNNSSNFVSLKVTCIVIQATTLTNVLHNLYSLHFLIVFSTMVKSFSM